MRSRAAARAAIPPMTVQVEQQKFSATPPNYHFMPVAAFGDNHEVNTPSVFCSRLGLRVGKGFDTAFLIPIKTPPDG